MSSHDRRFSSLRVCDAGGPKKMSYCVTGNVKTKKKTFMSLLKSAFFKKGNTLTQKNEAASSSKVTETQYYPSV
jgi:hypothetical protein